MIPLKHFYHAEKYKHNENDETMHVLDVAQFLCSLISLVEGSQLEENESIRSIEKENTKPLLIVRLLSENEKFSDTDVTLKQYVIDIYQLCTRFTSDVSDTLEMFISFLNVKEKRATRERNRELKNLDLKQTLCVFNECYENKWQKKWTKSILKMNEREIRFDLVEINHIIETIGELLEKMSGGLETSHRVSRTKMLYQWSYISKKQQLLTTKIKMLTEDELLKTLRGVINVDSESYGELKVFCKLWTEFLGKSAKHSSLPELLKLLHGNIVNITTKETPATLDNDLEKDNIKNTHITDAVETIQTEEKESNDGNIIGLNSTKTAQTKEEESNGENTLASNSTKATQIKEKNCNDENTSTTDSSNRFSGDRESYGCEDELTKQILQMEE